MSSINSPDFWLAAWQQAADGSPFRRFYPDVKRVWDISARSYDAGMGNDSERVAKVLKILAEMNFWQGAAKRVLDIGSGTGLLAIPLAERGAVVDALDCSPEMNRVLQQKCTAGNIQGIRIIAEDFRRHQLREKSYDLVIGSMNPCLYEPEAFQEMLTLSRDLVIYIGIAANAAGGQVAEKSLAELLARHSAGHNGSNLVNYPFNLLLAMGWQPKLEYVFNQWEYAENPEQAKANFGYQFEHLRETVPEMDKIIAEYVARHTENGKYIQRSATTMGIVACRVHR